MELIKIRTELIIDYISQILVYGSNTKGIIGFDKHEFDNGEFVIASISVIKNNYFRWHNLGIPITDSSKFYNYLLKTIMKKFKEFDLSFEKNSLIVKSKVNNNIIEVGFTLNSKKDHDFMDKAKNLFNNKGK